LEFKIDCKGSKKQYPIFVAFEVIFGFKYLRISTHLRFDFWNLDFKNDNNYLILSGTGSLETLIFKL